MRCEGCPYRVAPFFYCSRLRQPLDDGKTVIRGCNVDGKMDWVEGDGRDP